MLSKKSVLKGNFRTKKEVVAQEQSKEDDDMKLAKELKKQALASLGGSMVYMERERLVWEEKEE